MATNTSPGATIRAADGHQSPGEPTLTGLAFQDSGFDGQFLRVLDTIASGGADIGEAFITARRIPDGDRDAWNLEWNALGERILGEAEKSLASGHRVSAREGFLRAATYFRISGVFMYAPPMDPRFVAANARQRDAFRRAIELMDHPFEQVAIPYEWTELDGYVATPPGPGPFPTVILVGGYDGTMEETYVAGGVAALRRGYAVLMMDGPGQGAALVERDLHFRHDWEVVVTAQVDWLVARPEVDASRIAALGRSWGGHLAPRAATAEHRLAAVIADAPQYAPGANASLLLPAEYRGDLDTGDVDEQLNEVVRAGMAQSPGLNFSVGRGMLTHGCATPVDYMRELRSFTLNGLADRIDCPVLLTIGQNDPRIVDAQSLFDALTAPKTMIEFTNAEGAGEHDEAGAAALFSQRAFDWLDTVLGR
ncbi:MULTISPECIES: alpha/beta fold hydrolase [unclassified Dietzia]|uniref:alpha/beta hydrolase family protein n=2 Tax=Dietzia TaxID=37914 RepID=UPI0015FBE96F|nr:MULTISPECIES: alpha/beta fold hydrolase [unclassified Dietzia]MBB1040450.1 alpha/beta fold hydrolase [Dietzia sp. Cai40]MBB1043059.1 alpha/beta fold hydrolase [Dietzia sp. DQ11-44]MBB1052870.1 alpha/beta fold hydrolase [Dietzia sp. B44]MBB1056627.1 alpha/beta fold hydrolase [Dietzia sp. B19]